MTRTGKVALATVATIVAGAAAFWFLTAPQTLTAGEVAALGDGDATRGERIFHAGGCTSCHARPGAGNSTSPELAGGVELKTPFGTFVAPNISPDPNDGIGDWTVEQFANAMLNGVSPQGEHLYPAFPYTSYRRMKPQDVTDLFAYLKTLPPVAGKAAEHDLAFPYSLRRGLGLWKILYLSPGPVISLAADASESTRLGQYLVEGPGHCGECHTPRDLIGGPDKSQWLAGAVAAEGEGNVPNVTSGEGGIGSWSQDEIAYFLESGFTPDFDSVGGSMVEVQKNMAQLTAADRQAIAAYLKAVPPHPNGYAANR